MSYIATHTTNIECFLGSVVRRMDNLRDVTSWISQITCHTKRISDSPLASIIYHNDDNDDNALWFNRDFIPSRMLCVRYRIYV